MITNRSIPCSTVIPELAYADVSRAADWLCGAFGFSVRLRIANHRVQMNVGDGAVVLAELRAPAPGQEDGPERAHSVMVRVEDVDAHSARASRFGARIVRQLETYPFGERQYTAVDDGGQAWTFTQSVADVDPRDWGGTPEQNVSPITAE